MSGVATGLSEGIHGSLSTGLGIREELPEVWTVT
jgi:hypothetical protein